MLTIKDHGGEWRHGQQQVQGVIVENLKETFRANFPEQHHITNIDLVLREMDLPQLSGTNKAMLERPFLDNEILSAMFSIDNTKSPGPDGYSATFFKENSEMVGQSVCDAVRNFLVTDFLLKEWNHSLVVMISKREILEEVGHLRPISLCNTVYRCALKCLAK